MNPRLIICRTPAAVPLARRLASGPATSVASDDPRVHRAFGNAARFIELPESFHTVADEVSNLIETISGWLSQWARPEAALFRETLRWNRNVEGGLTSQRVQDAVLLIHSYQRLLQGLGAVEVHLIAEPGFAWDDLVLEEVLRSRRVLFIRHSLGGFRVRRWAAMIRPYAIAGYCWGGLLRLGAGWRRPEILRWRDGAIFFQLISSWRKHVDNIADFMATLQAQGAKPVALCWAVSERIPRETGATQLAAHGLEVVRLERWLSLGKFCSNTLIGAMTAWKVLRTARQPGFWRELSYREVPLRHILAESLRYFMVVEVPQRLQYQSALAACLAEARPLAFKPWAGPESFEGAAARQILKRQNSAPLWFHYWLGASIDWPYEYPDCGLSYFLAAGVADARRASKVYCLAADQVEVVGHARFSRHVEFSAATSVAASRRELQFPPGGGLYVGCDPGGVVRGYMSLREQLDMTTALVNAAIRTPGIIIVIKPHPSYTIEYLLPLLSEAPPGRIVVLPRFASVQHFLNAVDVIVTKYSTLILEASLMSRPSIAALFDGEPRFQVFGDIPFVTRSGSELEALVILLASKDAFTAWRSERLATAARLLPEFYFASSRPPALLAAEALLRRLGAPQLVHEAVG